MIEFGLESTARPPSRCISKAGSHVARRASFGVDFVGQATGKPQTVGLLGHGETDPSSGMMTPVSLTYRFQISIISPHRFLSYPVL